MPGAKSFKQSLSIVNLEPKPERNARMPKKSSFQAKTFTKLYICQHTQGSIDAGTHGVCVVDHNIYGNRMLPVSVCCFMLCLFKFVCFYCKCLYAYAYAKYFVVICSAESRKFICTKREGKLHTESAAVSVPINSTVSGVC